MTGACALDGIRVIDFGQYIAGPMAAMFLADHGADVIRIDPPGGPRYDTPANATWNRGKRSIVLDLKQENDRETARRLIATADVLIENFRPGVMDKLGLGPAAMTAEQPRLIYCSMPGFAADDPRADVAAWEGVIAAATGTYRPDSSAHTGRPVYTAIPISSTYAAFQAAVGITMALIARVRSGVGQRIELPLFDATFAAIGRSGMKVHDHPETVAEFDWSRQLPCKDGRWFMYVSPNKRFRAFLEAIGAAQWVDAKLSAEELGRRTDALFRTRTAREWENYCAELGTEGVVCHTSAEWLAHPQALASKIIADFEDPELGAFRGPGINVRLSETPGAVRAPRPSLDAQRAEILRELSSSKPAPAPAAETVLRSALEGVKVLDLCIILAGPTCGRTLAEYGADVIKIDGPQRSFIQRHCDINRGKRSMVLDLKTAEGLEILMRLVDQADVVLENFRSGVADRLGIGYEALRARRPDIVYCSMNAYGQLGPYAGRPGHEQIAQAVTGMQLRYGSAKPALQPFVVNDYGTGLMGCYAVALALMNRSRTGKGQRVDTALAYTATMMQCNLLQGYQGKQWDEPHGQDALGSGPLHRAYQASDGWIFLAARPRDLACCPELADVAAATGAVQEQKLEERLRNRSVEEWVSALTRAGVGAHRIVADAYELMLDPWVRAHGLSITREHDEIGMVTTTGPAIRLSRTPVVPGKPASKPGSDAAGILGEIGMRDEMKHLIEQGIIKVDGIKAM